MHFWSCMARTLETAKRLCSPAPVRPRAKPKAAKSAGARAVGPAASSEVVPKAKASVLGPACSPPPDIRHPVLQPPVERARGKSTALLALGYRRSEYEFACRHCRLAVEAFRLEPPVSVSSESSSSSSSSTSSRCSVCYASVLRPIAEFRRGSVEGKAGIFEQRPNVIQQR